MIVAITRPPSGLYLARSCTPPLHPSLQMNRVNEQVVVGDGGYLRFLNLWLDDCLQVRPCGAAACCRRFPCSLGGKGAYG